MAASSYFEVKTLRNVIAPKRFFLPLKLPVIYFLYQYDETETNKYIQHCI